MLFFSEIPQLRSKKLADTIIHLQLPNAMRKRQSAWSSFLSIQVVSYSTSDVASIGIQAVLRYNMVWKNSSPLLLVLMGRLVMTQQHATIWTFDMSKRGALARNAKIERAVATQLNLLGGKPVLAGLSSCAWQLVVVLAFAALLRSQHRWFLCQSHCFQH